MINSGQEYIYKAWWLILFPGVALVTTLISINLTGKRIQDMINPGLKA
jgi:ABC-type dipeptide/oligopeptide/nickel transport system permease subunit